MIGRLVKVLNVSEKPKDHLIGTEGRILEELDAMHVIVGIDRFRVVLRKDEVEIVESPEIEDQT